MRKLTAFDDVLGESEATFFSVNAGGNPEEQWVEIKHIQFIHNLHLMRKTYLYICYIIFRFIVKDRCTTFTSSQRSLIVMQVLLRTRFDDTEKVRIVTNQLDYKWDRIYKLMNSFICVLPFSVESGDCWTMEHFWLAFPCMKVDMIELIPLVLYLIEE